MFYSRITDPDAPFKACLADNNGQVLKFEPDNEAPPPQGRGTQLLYRALPHYEATFKNLQTERKQHIQKLKKQLENSRQKGHEKKKIEDKIQLLNSKSQPIPIIDEEEMAYLFLQEYYKKQPKCAISTLDPSAVLNILSKASSFALDIQRQAAKVRDEVRNPWAHAVIGDWQEAKMDFAFTEMEKLANLLPLSYQGDLLKALEDNKKGAVKTDILMRDQLILLDYYRNGVKQGKQTGVSDQIGHLEDSNNQEIYIERKVREQSTGQETYNLEDLFSHDNTVLLKAEAGAGKSSLSAKIVQRWAQGNILKNITCLLMLRAGSDMKVPLLRIIWEDFTGAKVWSAEQFENVFLCLSMLADEGRLAIIIEGIDELGHMTPKNITKANTAAIYPTTEIDMKTACAGILTKKVFSGAKVIATGRNTEMVNCEILKNKAKMYELLELNDSDREIMVQLMEQNPKDQNRIKLELENVSTAGNKHLLKKPLFTKSIIQLSVSRNVDMRKVKNSSQVFLMVVLKNLDYHSEQAQSLTGLDPPEYHQYLNMCFKMCKQKLQTKHDRDINTIRGTSINVVDKGTCFKIDVADEVFQIPIDFLKKLGIFDIHTDGGKLDLRLLHLSYLEFLAAGSLCGDGIAICYELKKIVCDQRYKAVCLYLAGMFAKETGIEFLNVCQNLCENFLELMGNKQQEACLQSVFWSIWGKWGKSDGGEEVKVTIMENSWINKLKTIGRNTKVNEESIKLLCKAVAVSGEISIAKKVICEATNGYMIFDHRKLVIEVNCVSFINLLSILKQDWRAEILNLDQEPTKEEWSLLASMVMRGNFGQVKVEVNGPLKGTEEDLISVSRAAESVKVKGRTRVDTEEDARLLHSLLSSTPAWTMQKLVIFAATDKSWMLLEDIMAQGRISWIGITKEAVGAASEKQLNQVWEATDDKWRDFYTTVPIASKSEGVAGFQKILQHRRSK